MTIDPDGAHSGAIIRTALRNCWLFADAGPAQLEQIARACNLRNYSRGATISTGQGAERQVLLAISGLMEMSHTTEVGKRFVMNLIGPGELAGLIRLFEDPHVAYGYIAREHSAVIHLPCTALLELLDAEPRRWRTVAKEALLRKAASVGTVLDQAVIGSVDHRIAATIQRIAKLFGVQGEQQSTRIKLRLSQDDLADMLCVSRQTVNKELQRLERDGVIRCAYNTVVIVDPVALQKMVDSAR